MVAVEATPTPLEAPEGGQDAGIQLCSSDFFFCKAYCPVSKCIFYYALIHVNTLCIFHYALIHVNTLEYAHEHTKKQTGQSVKRFVGTRTRVRI